MSQNNSNVKFIIGLILIFLGWLICFNLFLLIIGAPLFLIGSILVLISKKSILVKIITIVVPIILWWTGFEIIMYLINKKTSITVIVPYQFKGQVRVVYGEKGGLVPKEVDGRMELEIAGNGILIIKPYLESGLNDIKYYYKDAQGVRSEINQMKDLFDITVKRPAAYFEGGRCSTGEEPDTIPSLDYIYDSFYVLKNDSDKVETYVEETKSNALTDSLVKVSRQLK